MAFIKVPISKNVLKPLYWVFSVFFVAYLLNSCGDAFEAPKELRAVSSQVGDDAELDPSAVNYLDYSTTGSGSGSSSNATGGFAGAGSTPITGSSSSSSSGGYAESGGRLDQGSTDESSTTTITYDDYNGTGFNYFEKMTEPEGTYVPEGQAFALQFSAIGRFPLKYVWYKKTETGKRVVGTDSTVFSKISAQLSDAGNYFATVEDADGNILTSKTVTLSVRPSDKPCKAGKYGRSSRNGINELVDESYVPVSLESQLVSISYKRATYTVELTCNELFKTGFFTNYESCSGEIIYQCVGGKYQKVSGQCNCQENTGGG